MGIYSGESTQRVLASMVFFCTSFMSIMVLLEQLLNTEKLITILKSLVRFTQERAILTVPVTSTAAMDTCSSIISD